MAGRVIRMVDKTTTAPFVARDVTLERVARFRPRDFFDIVAIVGGAGRHISYARGRAPNAVELTPGTLVLYRPVDDVVISSTAPGGLAVRYVSFPAAEWTTFANMVGVDSGWTRAVDPPTVKFDLRDERVANAYDAATHQYSSDEATPLDLVRFWIDIIPTMFPQTRPAFSGSGAPEWLLDALESMRMEGNLQQGISRLLELSHVSAPHLSATVRRYYGRTPTELIREMRLRHAAMLLSTSTVTIGKIATRCGFRSFAYFSTAFRHQYHLTPREYRVQSIARFGTNSAMTRSATIELKRH